MSAQSKDAIRALAEFLTGPEVGHASIGLEMPDGPLQIPTRARRFFELRRVFGVTGYATADEAVKHITESLKS